MSVQFPYHLYIRVDRPLRAGLIAAAENAGLSVSELVRRALRRQIADPVAKDIPSSIAFSLDHDCGQPALSPERN